MKPLSEKEKQNMRRQLLDTVERRLPSLVAAPVPRSIRDEQWFKQSNIGKDLKVFAFPGFQIGIFSGKLMPALKLWLAAESQGKFKDNPMVIGATSGNWGKDAAVISRIFNVKGFTAVVNSNTPSGKLNHLRAAGAGVLKSPEGVPATDYVYELAKKPGYVLLDQYVEDESISGHEWTMNHIAREIDKLYDARLINGKGFVFVAVTGTCSTIMAADRYLKKKYLDRKIKIAGVASMSKKEKVPGSRSPEDLEELVRIGGFPYRQTLDFDLITNITRHQTYALNVERIQESLLPVGPTGALAEAGFYDLLRQKAESGRLDDLKNEQGEIIAMIFWMDSYLAYIDDPDYLSFFT